MDLHQIKQILDLVREHDLAEFEIEHDGLRLKSPQGRQRRSRVSLPPPAAPHGIAAAGASASAPSVRRRHRPAAAIAASTATDAADAEIELAVVKSPIVGTFYRSSEPGSPSFVEIGSTVKKGDVLCIIEAMKLMNEIDSEYDGEVVNIYVENGQPVQYGERLFAIEPESDELHADTVLSGSCRDPCSRRFSSRTAAKWRCASSMPAASSASRPWPSIRRPTRTRCT